MNRPLADPDNDLTSAIVSAPEGTIFPTKTEVSDPQKMTEMVKELGRWFGADGVGIATLEQGLLQVSQDGDDGEENLLGIYGFGIVCAMTADRDPAKALGLGGTLVVQNGAIVNFNLGAYIRELGYRATIGGANPQKVAAASGLARLDRQGRAKAHGLHGHVHLTDVILTDLPLVPGSQTG